MNLALVVILLILSQLSGAKGGEVCSKFQEMTHMQPQRNLLSLMSV